MLQEGKAKLYMAACRPARAVSLAAKQVTLAAGSRGIGRLAGGVFLILLKVTESK